MDDNASLKTGQSPLRPEILTILTTEHYNLQSGHSGTISEALGRSSLYLGSVSSSLIALGFVQQFSVNSDLFFLFCLALFPVLFFLGLVTFGRLLQTAIEDNIYIRGINRIRHFYAEIAPELKDYFVLSVHDDGAGTMYNQRLTYSKLQSFSTSAGLISVINSVLIAVFAGIVIVNIFRLPTFGCVLCSVVVFGISLSLHQFYQVRKWIRIERQEKVLFPSPGPALSYKSGSSPIIYPPSGSGSI